MIAYRYANLRWVSFINDEPAFLTAARAQLGDGHWVAVSPLVGKQGLHYGPAVLWFYGVVHKVFGSDPSTHIFAMLTCMVAAHVALAFGIGRRFGALAGAASLALIASSPYQFFWSRLAWDQCVDIGSALVAFMFCAFNRITPGVGAFLGLTIGLAVSSHLMVLPLAIIACAFVAFEAIAEFDSRPLVNLGAVALLVNVPYLLYMSHHFHEASPTEPLSWDLARKYALSRRAKRASSASTTSSTMPGVTSWPLRRAGATLSSCLRAPRHSWRQSRRSAWCSWPGAGEGPIGAPRSSPW